MKKKILIIVAVLVFGLILATGYQVSLGMAKYLPSPYQGFLSQAHFRVKSAAANLADALLPKTYLHNQLERNIKKFNLLMTTSDIKAIKDDEEASVELGYNDKQRGGNQQIKLVYSGQELSAKLGFHGGGAGDFIFSKSDYNLELIDNAVIDGTSNFTLFNPQTHNWLVPMLANSIAERLNLYFSVQEPVSVRINGKKQGVFTLEEKVDTGWLKRRQLNDSWLIKLRDETRLAHRMNTVALNAHHLSGWDFAIANVDPLQPENPTVLLRLDNFYKAIQAGEIEKLAGFVDLDYWARYDAYRQFLGIDHDVAGDDLIMFFSAQEGKFYPVVRNEGDLNRLAIEAGSVIKSYNQYDSHLAAQYGYPRVFLLLNRLPEFRQRKYKYLYQLSVDYPEVKDSFKEIYGRYADIFIYDTSDNRSALGKKKLFAGFLDIFEHNLSLINQEIEFGQIGVNVISAANEITIEVLPDSLVPLTFDHFELILESNDSLDLTSVVNRELLMSDYDENMNVVMTSKSFPMTGNYRVIGVKATAKNSLTQKTIPVFWAVAGNQNNP